MRKSFLYITILVFAIILLIPISVFAQTPVPEGCILQSYSLYRPVALNIVHDDAIIIDPKYSVPQGQPSIVVQPSNSDNEKRTNSGYNINGTGTYVIDFALTHAGTKQVTEDNPYGQRLLELYITSAGERTVATNDYYSIPDYCKVYELRITEKPIIPTDEEFAKLAYGVITPIIEDVEKAVVDNTESIERNSDRQGIFTIFLIGLVAVTLILNWQSRRDKTQVLEDYNLINQRLRNQEQQQINDGIEFDRQSKETLEHQKKILQDFAIYFNIQIEGKMKDLGHVIHGFFTKLNEAEFDIPEYNLPEEIPDDLSLPEPCPCGICDYVSKPFAYPVKQTAKLDYLTSQLKEPVTTKDVVKGVDLIKAVFQKKEKQKKDDDDKPNIQERHDHYAKMVDHYRELPNDEKSDYSELMRDYNEKTKELITRYGY